MNLTENVISTITSSHKKRIISITEWTELFTFFDESAQNNFITTGRFIMVYVDFQFITSS